MAAYLAVPELQVGWFFNVISLSAVAAILVGVRVHRPRHVVPWYLFAVAQFLFAGGDVIAYNYQAFFGTELPFPAISDPFYLAVYPCIVIGLIRIISLRSPGRDLEAVIDGLIISIGAATLSWQLILAPIAAAADVTIDQTLVALAYPAGDLVLLTVVVRLALMAGRRRASLYLMVGAVLALLATDSIYSYANIQGIEYVPGLLDVGWGAFYLLWGVAALHPSMAELTTRASDEEGRPSWIRLGALAGATLVTELLQFIQDATDGVSQPFLYVATTVLFVLVLARMAGLIQRLQTAADRQRTMRVAASGLVTAVDTRGVLDVAIRAAHALAGTAATLRVVVATEAGQLQIAGQGDGGTVIGEPLDVSMADVPIGSPAESIDVVAPGSLPSILANALQLPAQARFAGLIPIPVGTVRMGLFVIASRDRPRRALVDSLIGLASQVGQAMESLALTEIRSEVRSQRRLESLIQNSSDVILILDERTGVQFASSAADRVLGYPAEDLQTRTLADLVRPEELTRVLAFLERIVSNDGPSTAAIEFEIRRADGRWLHVETLVSNLIRDPDVRGIVLNLRDISERKAFEEQLSRQAFNDALTGLPNRALFLDRIEHALARQLRNAETITVFFLDLDDFKTVNDSLGHTAGDQLLMQAAERLRQCLRPSDTAARFGGDEFSVLVEVAGEPILLAERILATLREPFVLDGTEVQISATIGIATSQRSSTATELLRDADVAMYAAKAEGKGGWRQFEPSMHESVRTRLELKGALERGIAAGEFVLHYQPIVDMATGQLRGIEALVRWIHPERGLVSPIEFIPLAEETGLIVPLGRWVLEEASRASLALEALGGDIPYMSVNLSARQLQQPELVGEIDRLIRDSGVTPGRLVLEITESAMMRDTDLMVSRLLGLRELGIRIAIDDFGTGYSSLNYLRHLPVDIVKIDQSFVTGIVTDPAQRAVVATIIDLGHLLGLQLIAEGVETPDQRDVLTTLGCELGQGFLWARPIELDGVISYRTGAGTRVVGPTADRALPAGTGAVPRTGRISRTPESAESAAAVPVATPGR